MATEAGVSVTNRHLEDCEPRAILNSCAWKPSSRVRGLPEKVVYLPGVGHFMLISAPKPASGNSTTAAQFCGNLGRSHGAFDEQIPAYPVLPSMQQAPSQKIHPMCVVPGDHALNLAC